jgi:hypothetical protein
MMSSISCDADFSPISSSYWNFVIPAAEQGREVEHDDGAIVRFEVGIDAICAPAGEHRGESKDVHGAVRVDVARLVRRRGLWGVRTGVVVGTSMVVLVGVA